MLGGRSPGFVARQALKPENYRAAARIGKTAVHPFDFACRYFLGGGDYPARCPVRTPLGVVAPLVYSHHDVWTVNEVFCRLDYRLPPGATVVVDIGSNIGISALYFLTRSPDVRCYLFEPDPRNVERLAVNIASFDDRCELATCAVGDLAGTVAFGREPTGRYGGIGVMGTERIEVSCRHIDEVLRSVLDVEGRVDMLKIDTEGVENRTVAALNSELLEHVGVICFETTAPFNPAPQRLRLSYAAEVARLERRGCSV
jgi:FkbM family methyltransferase